MTPERLPGRRIVAAAWASGTLFAGLAVPAALGVDALDGAAVALDLAMFLASLPVWLYAFALAVARTARGDDVSVAGLFFLQGSAPRAARWHLLGATAATTVLAAATAAADPYGVLVPMLPLGLSGLWGARHGVYPPRTVASTRRSHGRPGQ